MEAYWQIILHDPAFLHIFWTKEVDSFAQGCLPRDFPGGPVVRTPCFHCRGHGFHPWSGSEDPTCQLAWPKKEKKDVCLLDSFGEDRDSGFPLRHWVLSPPGGVLPLTSGVLGNKGDLSVERSGRCASGRCIRSGCPHLGAPQRWRTSITCAAYSGAASALPPWNLGDEGNQWRHETQACCARG